MNDTNRFFGLIMFFSSFCGLIGEEVFVDTWMVSLCIFVGALVGAAIGWNNEPDWLELDCYCMVESMAIDACKEIHEC